MTTVGMCIGRGPWAMGTVKGSPPVSLPSPTTGRVQAKVIEEVEGGMRESPPRWLNRSELGEWIVAMCDIGG